MTKFNIARDITALNDIVQLQRIPVDVLGVVCKYAQMSDVEIIKDIATKVGKIAKVATALKAKYNEFYGLLNPNGSGEVSYHCLVTHRHNIVRITFRGGELIFGSLSTGVCVAISGKRYKFNISCSNLTNELNSMVVACKRESSTLIYGIVQIIMLWKAYTS